MMVRPNACVRFGPNLSTIRQIPGACFNNNAMYIAQLAMFDATKSLSLDGESRGNGGLENHKG